jgi:MetJ family transcriptional regulator, methionine regulon repressor
MGAVKYVEPYIERGYRSSAVKKITVSVPLHILRLLSDERTRRQTSSLRHATNSELLCEAFLHAFTGQPLPTDEELTMKAASKSTKKTGTVKAAAKSAKKTAKKPAKKAAAKKTAKKVARKPAKKAAKKKAK